MILKMWEKSLKLHLIWFSGCHWIEVACAKCQAWKYSSQPSYLHVLHQMMIWLEYISILLNGNEWNSCTNVECIDNRQYVYIKRSSLSKEPTEHSAAQLYVWHELLLNIWLSTFCILHFSFYRIIGYFFILKHWKINFVPLQWQFKLYIDFNSMFNN